MTSGNHLFKVGQIVTLRNYKALIVHLHSGYFDFQYTGTCVETGKVVYFDDEDILN